MTSDCWLRPVNWEGIYMQQNLADTAWIYEWARCQATEMPVVYQDYQSNTAWCETVQCSLYTNLDKFHAQRRNTVSHSLPHTLLNREQSANRFCEKKETTTNKKCIKRALSAYKWTICREEKTISSLCLHSTLGSCPSRLTGLWNVLTVADGVSIMTEGKGHLPTIKHLFNNTLPSKRNLVQGAGDRLLLELSLFFFFYMSIY